jgi:tetratricopeptide (TPR) repeat protein
VIEVLGGELAALFALDRYEELFQDDPENWCQLALSAPERSLLDLLEQQLPRRQRLFDETFYQLDRLLDVNHPELDSVAGRVQKAQTEQRTRLANFQRGEWFNQTLILELKCPECSDSNEYKVRQVAVSPGGKADDMLLADEFPCASCGGWVDLEFTAGVHLAITAELLKMASEGGKERAGQSKTLITAEAPYYGKRLPVGEVVSRCKESVANNPNNISDWLRLGFCYHQVLSRPRQGLGYVERALALEPNAVEGVFQKANAMAMQGDKEEAFHLLEQALESKEHWRFFLTDVASSAQLTAQFARLYNELLGGLGKTDRARLHASFLGTSKKVGRNEPCPCGSGKKYKKCCLAKQ